MNLEQFRKTEARAVAMQSWCSFVTRHPEQFSEQDQDEAFFTGLWMWSIHVLYETQMIPPTQAEALTRNLGSSFQARKCPLAATTEAWFKLYSADPKRDLEVHVGDFPSIEAAMDAVQVMYHEALQGSAVRESLTMAA